MGVDTSPGGRNQPFYNVLGDDGSQRYAAHGKSNPNYPQLSFKRQSHVFFYDSIVNITLRVGEIIIVGLLLKCVTLGGFNVVPREVRCGSLSNMSHHWLREQQNEPQNKGLCPGNNTQPCAVKVLCFYSCSKLERRSPPAIQPASRARKILSWIYWDTVPAQRVFATTVP